MERVRHLRLDRAAALLRSTTMPVADVAQAVGYADPEAFATAFRRRFGRVPRVWRITPPALW
jgi:transcriptional regulator GlxA family with amidase domain